MAREREDDRLIQAALMEAASKQQLTAAQIQDLREGRVIDREKVNLAAQEIAEKSKLGREQIGSQEKIAGGDVAQKDRAAQLTAQMAALGILEKMESQRTSDQLNFLSDVSKRGDIPPGTLAQMMKSAGYPALQNAIDLERHQKAETLIRQTVPAIRAAKSDAEREKKIRPALDAVDPKAWDRAIALAYPKPGQIPPELSIKPPTVEAAPTPAGPNISELIAKALTGVASGAPEEGGGAPGRVAVPMANRLIQHGTIVGGPPGYDLNVNTGDWVPRERVGTFNNRPITEAIKRPVYSDVAAEHGITAPAPVAAAIQPTANVAPNIPLVPPPPIPEIAPELAPVAGMIGPTPTPTPADYVGQLLATPTPAPYGGRPPPVPVPSEIEAERAAEEARRRAEEEERRRIAASRQ